MTTLLYLFFFIRLFAPEYHCLLIKRDDGIKPAIIYKDLIYAVNMAEAQIDDVRFDTLAYNKYTKATGAFQITQIRLKDYNERTNNHYKLKDCYKYDIGLKIFLYYCSGSNKDIAYSWYGIDKNTSKYWLKVRKYLALK